MKPQYLTLDNREDRREIHGLLHRLPPSYRVSFLRWACKQVPQNGSGHLPEPAVWKLRATLEQSARCEKANGVLTNEIFMDLIQLFNTWGLDAAKTLEALTSLVRRLRV